MEEFHRGSQGESTVNLCEKHSVPSVILYFQHSVNLSEKHSVPSLWCFLVTLISRLLVRFLTPEPVEEHGKPTDQ
jgi:hypothetical protein